MTDGKKPRAGSMSDADRALAGRERRRAEVVDDETGFEQEDHFTPVSEVIERAADLTDRERQLLRYIWAHTANMEMRSRQRRETGDTAALEKRVDAVESDIIDIAGKSRNNGKLGSLRQRVDTFLARVWWLVTLLVGGVGAAAVKLIIVGRAYGELETQVDASKARLQLLESVVFLKSLPAPSPEKAQP